MNLWKPIFPWEDGQYIDIKPTRWYVDGDSWKIDLGSVGRKREELTQEDFEQVRVVPNPYLVHSDFESASSGGRIRFTKLPHECRIRIYTVSGELVDTFEHQSINNTDGVVNSGNEWWDLKNDNGVDISPGLYIYVVESIDESFKHIGKFAVVR